MLVPPLPAAAPVSPPTHRLRANQDIAAVLRGRTQHAGRLAVVYVRRGAHDGPARIAVVASRKVGSAVARNRAKRLLREAAHRQSWRDGLDVVLVARAACADSRLQPVNDEIGRLAVDLDALDPAGPRR